jgi:hypothetical protein
MKLFNSMLKKLTLAMKILLTVTCSCHMNVKHQLYKICSRLSASTGKTKSRIYSKPRYLKCGTIRKYGRHDNLKT